MARSQVGVAFMVLLVSMAMTTTHITEATITCDEVTTLLAPCIPFGVFGGIVPPDCCAGIKGLNAAEKTTEDRKTACACIQGAAGIPGIDYDRINMLGDLCGSHWPYKVYPSTDCSQVS